MLKFPLTCKSRIQQRSVSHGATQDIPLSLSQQYNNPSSSLVNQRSSSSSGDISFINTDMVRI